MSPRLAAKAAGQPTYLGRPCPHGHPGRRFTSNDNCAECKAARQARYRAMNSSAHRRREDAREATRAALERNTVLAEFYPAEFEAQGWRQV